MGYNVVFAHNAQTLQSGLDPYIGRDYDVGTLGEQCLLSGILAFWLLIWAG